jgi:ubiquinone/menaquinone biosynthesis C-methylase UbiE
MERESGGQLSDRLDQVRRDWETLGASDPLWAVLMKPGTRHGGWDRDAFLATGRSEVAEAMTHLARFVELTSIHTILDFGCGAGRLTQALANYADNVTGLDVSPSMLEVAGRLDRTQGKCTFVLNTRDDLSAFADGQFDLVYSSLVLQHLPPADASRFVSEFGRVVRPGGAVVVQVASTPLPNPKGLLFRYAPRKLLRFGQTHVLGYPAPMRMQQMSAATFADALRPWGVDVLDRVEDSTYGGHWTYHRYFAVKRADE